MGLLVSSSFQVRLFTGNLNVDYDFELSHVSYNVRLTKSFHRLVVGLLNYRRQDYLLVAINQLISEPARKTSASYLLECDEIGLAGNKRGHAGDLFTGSSTAVAIRGREVS